jgi:hypothetical protein
VHLRLDRYGGVAVALRDVETLHLHVPENFLVIAFVRAQERLEDLLALLREIPLLDVLGEDEIFRQSQLLQELHALLEGHEEERVVAQLAADARGDLGIRELGVAVEAVVFRGAVTPEAERGFAVAVGRENPVEPVHRAFGALRILLEAAHQAADDRAFGAAVRAVQQNEFIVHALADEALEDLVNVLLHAFLADEAKAGVGEVLVEHLEAAPVLAEVVHHVGDVLGARAHLPNGLVFQKVEILIEAEDPVLVFVFVFDGPVDIFRGGSHTEIVAPNRGAIQVSGIRKRAGNGYRVGLCFLMPDARKPPDT